MAGVPELCETQVRDNVWVWTFGGESLATSYGANCTAAIGREGVLLVDPLIAPGHARRIAEALRRKTDRAVRFVVLSHHHTDHALGSGWFAARGATVIAHAACRDAMAREHPALIESRRRLPELAGLFDDAESTPPALRFEEAIEIDLGDTTARVRHPGPAHTAGDSVVFLPRESVLIAGDLVSNGYHVNYEDADLSGVSRSLDALEALGARTCVPGHGAVSGPEAIAAQRRYHREVAAAVRETQDEESAAERLRALYPDYRLEILVPESVRRWSSESG